MVQQKPSVNRRGSETLDWNECPGAYKISNLAFGVLALMLPMQPAAAVCAESSLPWLRFPISGNSKQGAIKKLASHFNYKIENYCTFVPWRQAGRRDTGERNCKKGTLGDVGQV